MKNDLNKIKKLNNSQDLISRIGVAMFMHARNLDLETATDDDKALVKWILSNPMSADQTMVALVATEADIIANSNIIEETVPVDNPAKKPTDNVVPIIPTSNVNIDEVTDEIIEQAISKHWNTVANKYGGYITPLEPERHPAPVSESVTVIQGLPDNAFLEAERLPAHVKPATKPDGSIL